MSSKKREQGPVRWGPVSDLLLCRHRAVEGRSPQPSVDFLLEAFISRTFSVGAEGDEKHRLVDGGEVRPLLIG